MQELEFRKYLKTRGKKPHVIEELVRQANQFETYLNQARLCSLEEANAQDIHDYARWVEEQKPDSARVAVRGVALYYSSIGNSELAQAASAIRQAAIARTRSAFSLQDFSGVDPWAIQALKAQGVRTTDEMIAAGSTSESRRQLAAQTGLTLETITELVRLSDLARIDGVKGIRARLYLDAGVDSIAKLAAWEPEPLRHMLADYVQKTNFPGIAPLPKEVLHTIEAARRLPPVVEYDTPYLE